MSQSEDSSFARPFADTFVGSTVAGNYLIEGILGEGGMAIVYKARQVSTQRHVAIKTLKTQEQVISQRFAREMKTHAKLHHKNIVEAIDCFETTEGAYFVMELLNGVSLFDRLKSVGRIESAEDIYAIVAQILAALEHAHQFKIVHRDLKSPNIVLLNTANDSVHVKVLDFGIAKVQDDMQKLTGHGQALGSPLYMSPEQCMGQDVSNRSDLYTLGILGYELITGDLPYAYPRLAQVMAAHCDPNKRPKPISESRPDLGNVETLNQIIMKAIETEPDKRFQSASEFHLAMDHWIQTVRNGTNIPLPRAILQSVTSTSKEELRSKLSQRTASQAPTQPGNTRSSKGQFDQETAVKNFLLGLAVCCVIITSAGLAFAKRENIKDAFISISITVSSVLSPVKPADEGLADQSKQKTPAPDPNTYKRRPGESKETRNGNHTYRVF